MKYLQLSKSNKVYYSLLGFLITLFIVFNIYFPKSGIKLSGIPITTGYLIFFILIFLAFVGVLSKKGSYRINKYVLMHSILIFGFGCLFLVSFMFNGVADFGMALSLVLNLLLIPLFFFFFLLPFQKKLDIEKYLEYIRKGIIFVATYGIFLFIYKIFTGSFLEIPLLTVNLADVNTLETTKSIDRGGGVFKLISTYNNGNIYGICILMLLPLYAWLESSKFKLFIVKTSLILTLSRTVWAGLVMYELLKFFYSKFTLLKVIKFLLLLIFFISSIYTILNFLGWDLLTLFDTNLGGRREQLFFDVAFLPNKTFIVKSEIIYASIVYAFGLLGLIFFLSIMAFPIVLWYANLIKDRMIFKKYIVYGLLLYLLVSFSDGALLYIPVMMIYWFLVFLLYARGKYENTTNNP